jgi:D-apiose dehydrogenase
MTGKLQVATVGAGYFSRFHYEAWHRLEAVEIAAICDQNMASATEVASQYGISEIFNDFEKMLDVMKPDLVDIITPPSTHEKFIKAAVERSIPAICQKPFTQNYHDAKDLVDFIDRHNGTVIIHENFRFQPWYRKIAELLKSDSLGQIYRATFHLRPGDGQGPNAYMDRQPYFQNMERFLIHETAIHLIDVFRYLFGDPKSVYCDLKRLNPALSGEDSGIILLDFEDVAQCVFDGNRLSDHVAENKRLTFGDLTIEGEKKVLYLNGDGEISIRAHGSNISDNVEYDWNNRNFSGDCVYLFQQHVVRHLMEGTPLVNQAREYLRNIYVEEMAYRSNDETRKIDLTFPDKLN